MGTTDGTVIDAEFEEDTKAPSSADKKPSHYANVAAETVEVAAKHIRTVSPETAERLSGLAKEGRTIGQHLDGMMGAGKRAYGTVKDFGAKIDKVRPDPVLKRSIFSSK